MAAIWSEVVAIGGIGIHHHSFDHGGDSMRAFQILARFTGRFSDTLSAEALLTSPTIAAWTTAIAGLLVEPAQDE